MCVHLHNVDVCVTDLLPDVSDLTHSHSNLRKEYSCTVHSMHVDVVQLYPVDAVPICDVLLDFVCSTTCVNVYKYTTSFGDESIVRFIFRICVRRRGFDFR